MRGGTAAPIEILPQGPLCPRCDPWAHRCLHTFSARRAIVQSRRRSAALIESMLTRMPGLVSPSVEALYWNSKR